MSRSKATSVQNNFSKGLVTEATGLNFPENAVVDCENVVFHRDGTVSRRFGINLEDGFDTETINRTGCVVTSYVWRAAAGRGDCTLVVNQVGGSLYFYLAGSGAVSADYKGAVALSTYSPAGAPDPKTYECSFASGQGYLFVTHPYLNPFYVSYNPDTGALTAATYTIYTRDFDGVNDGLAVDENPTSLSNAHQYNLLNQGWDSAKISSWHTALSHYPSNANVWWLYKDSSDVFTPSLSTSQVTGTYAAPKGHYLYNAFNIDRVTKSGLSGLTSTTAGTNRPQAVAFFAGRVWYAGCQASGYSNRIFFSQVVQGDNQFGTCYQSGDPTSEYSYDLLASDGGVVNIVDAGLVYKLFALSNSLLVFASNGVWAIAGDAQAGFTANSYSVRKVSSVPSISVSSYVDINGYPFWWNADGIYYADLDNFGNIQVTHLSLPSINSFFAEIPLESKRTARGAFNPITGIAQWVYRSNSPSDTTESYEYDSVLCYNVITKAFYTYLIDPSNATINGVLQVDGHSRSLVFSEDAKAICLIPSAGEFVYDTVNVEIDVNNDGTEWVTTNCHDTENGRSDIQNSLDNLQDLAPAIENVSLYVAWFGDDLRADYCTITPRHEGSTRVTRPYSWEVAGLTRSTARSVSMTDGSPNYGGTPSDASVTRAIQELKSRGLGVTFSPFILMDIPSGNTLPNPYGGSSQPVNPWRGRITCNPAIGQGGSPDKTGDATTQVEAFYNGTWGFRNFILHYANLCASAGGVDTFLIGSEMRGLTWVRSAAGAFPFVTRLGFLAAEVKAILPDAKVTYGADWSEYFGYNPGDGTNDFYFHLDPLWSSPNIDAIGIDNYWPLSDWRDGTTHADYLDGYTSIYSTSYLQDNIAGGEGYYWYYESSDDRDSQTCTIISDGAYSKPWVFRYKDIKNWWLNSHYNRPGGSESASPTAWVPQSKPFWFTELGCPAIDKGPNQPNVFYDPNSSESAYPYYSSGERDDTIQLQMLYAYMKYYGEVANNPISSVYSAPMVDTSRMYFYTWDARPYPEFPNRSDIWADYGNWKLGHWLTGRLQSLSVVDYKQPDLYSSVFKYVCSYRVGSSYAVTFADERDTRFLDWLDAPTGYSGYTSYFDSGYAVHGEGMRKWSPGYLFLYGASNGTTLEFKTIWDYTKNDKESRWTQQKTIEFSNPNKKYDFHRIKIRGAGRACQFKVSSVDGKPFTLLGWGLEEYGNAQA